MFFRDFKRNNAGKIYMIRDPIREPVSAATKPRSLSARAAPSMVEKKLKAHAGVSKQKLKGLKIQM